MKKLILTLASAMTLIFVFSAFTSAPSPAEDDKKLTVTIVGELLQGIECGVLETCNGSIVLLTSVPAPFQVGDVVKVRGEVIDGAFCFGPGMRGLRVRRMGYSSCP